jgi:WD40 repeat protein/Tfp pilus assembly protein PilF
MGDRAAGEIVGRYRIVRALGRGAMGVTYEAEPLEGGARVALKELGLAGVADWKIVELFERESRVLAMVTHPAVPAYVDHFSVDRDGGPAFCLVQQLAPGRTLADLVAGGWRAEEAEATRIAAALLDVLGYLHARRPPVFHRDIKPLNILREAAGKVWIVDFGAVRDVYRSTLGGGSTIAGTFGYMAPEQLHGVARPESDLYGVGATLVHALCGQAPTDIPHRKLRLDFRSRVKVSPAFGAWLEKMLEPAPEDRFPSARHALVALRQATVAAARPERATLRTIVLASALIPLLGLAAAVGWHEFHHVKSPGVSAGAAPRSLPERPARWRYPALRFVRSISAFVNPAKSVAYTPDAARLVGGSFDDTVKIWDARNGQPLRALPGHTGRVAEVRVSPDGRFVVTGGDHTIRSWSLPDGKPIRTIDAGALRIFDLALSPSGKMLASGHDDGRARMWDLDGTPLRTLEHGPGRVLQTAFSPDGTRLATAGDDGTIKIWDVAEGKLRCTLLGHTKAVGGLAMAPDGELLASASDDRSVKVWHMSRCALVTTLSLHSDEAWTVAFSPDGGTLVTGGKDNILGVWAIPSAELKQRVELGERAKGTLGLAFTADGTTLATAHASGAIWIWRVARAGGHAPLPELELVEGNAPWTGSAEDRAYAEGMDVVDTYHGQAHALDAAEARFEAMRRENPRSARALVGLGFVAVHRAFEVGTTYDEETLRGALAFADQALALDPTFPPAYSLRAWVLHDQKDTNGARAALDAGLRLAPHWPGLLSLRADLQRADGDPGGSETTLREMLSGPVSRARAGGALESLADVLADMGDLDAADQARQKQIEVVPDSAWAKGDYAEFLLRRGDCKGAIAMASRAVAQLSYGAGKETLARAYCAEGEGHLWDDHDAPAARRSFDAASHAFPSSACAAYGLGAYHQYLGVTQDKLFERMAARAEYERALSLDPKDGLARKALDAL